MPLTPAMRPFRAISSTAARPISAPPSAEAIGVKEVAVISASSARENDAPTLARVAQGKRRLTLPLNFEDVLSGFLQPFLGSFTPSARGRRTPRGQRRPPIAHGDFTDVADIADTALVSPRIDAGCHGVARRAGCRSPTSVTEAWRKLADRAIEPNGYYLPDWELAVDASARGRTDVSALGAWSDAAPTRAPDRPDAGRSRCGAPTGFRCRRWSAPIPMARCARRCSIASMPMRPRRSTDAARRATPAPMR